MTDSELNKILWDVFGYPVKVKLNKEPNTASATSTTKANNIYGRVPCVNLDIKKVVFNDPATIVFWSDGTKTVVKTCKGDSFKPDAGLAFAILKKMLGKDYKGFFKRNVWDIWETEKEKEKE